MAEPSIGDAELIAWIDGELSPDAAAQLVEAIEKDPELAARVGANHGLAGRMTSAFGPSAEEPVPLARGEPAAVISLAAARAARAETARKPQRWAVPGAIAASLLVGILVGHQGLTPGEIADRSGSLALAPPIAHALPVHLPRTPLPIPVTLPFPRGRAGY